MSATIPWACPKCGAPAGGHGKGGVQKCEYLYGGNCDGLICECVGDQDDDHGAAYANPCRSANCYHCGWGGTFPVKPKGLQAWERKALDAGWSPPAHRLKELGMVKP